MILMSLEAKEAKLCGSLLLKGLKVLVDDRNREKDSGSRSDGAHEISQHSECSDAHSSERRCGRDVSVQLLLQVRLAMPRHHHLLFLITSHQTK